MEWWQCFGTTSQGQAEFGHSATCLSAAHLVKHYCRLSHPGSSLQTRFEQASLEQSQSPTDRCVTTQFLRAALTFEDTDMDAALALLPPIHRAAQAAATAAGRKSGWLSWGSQGEVGLLPKLVALRGDVAVGGSEMICALIGLFRMSVSGYVSIAAPSFHTIEIVVDWDAISGT